MQSSYQQKNHFVQEHSQSVYLLVKSHYGLQGLREFDYFLVREPVQDGLFPVAAKISVMYHEESE